MLTTRAGEPLAFGYEAEQQYGDEPAGDSDSDDATGGDGQNQLNQLLFRQFKMMLNNGEVNIQTILNNWEWGCGRVLHFSFYRRKR